MSSDPYIGVSGFMTAAEVRAALDAFPACGRRLMVGVLASSKSLYGIPTRWGRRYPAPRDIAAIFPDDHRALNLIHYATGGEEDPERLISAFSAALAWGGLRCHGIQINAAWPPPPALEGLRYRAPQLWVVLQLGPRAMAADFFGEDMVETLRAYEGAVTDVLIDASGGLGIALDVDLAQRVIDACRRALPGVGVGIAGGLCAEAIPGVAHLMRAGCSTDVEGKVRDDADGGGNLVPVKMTAYLAAAGKALE